VAPVFAPGVVGQAFSFDGINGYVEIPDSDLFDLGADDFTIEFWVNFRSLKPDSSIVHPAVIFIGNDEGAYQVNKVVFCPRRG
jgi:hypothetical protein